MLNVMKFSVLSLFAIVGLVGCSAIPLNPNAQRVIASKSPAPKGCKFVASLVGSQGGALTGGFTANKTMAEGSMNDLRNQAANMNANYVQIEAERAGVTGSFSVSEYGASGSSQQTDVTMNGNAYYCDPKEIGLD
jgi:hypothetical protein